MREIRPSGSEVGGTELNQPLLPLSLRQSSVCRFNRQKVMLETVFGAILEPGMLIFMIMTTKKVYCVWLRPGQKAG